MTFEIPQKLYFIDNKFDALGKSAEFIKEKSGYLYYAKFEGSSSFIKSINKKTFNDGLNKEYFIDKKLIKEEAIKNLESYKEFIKNTF